MHQQQSEQYDYARWMKSLGEGDEEAFACVFRAHYKGLLSYAGRILRDAELANDTVQEAFCRLYENRARVAITSSIKAYLYKTVFNACLDAIKHRKIEHAYVNQELFDFYLSRIVQTPEAEMAMHDETINEELQKAIARLPDRCREIFLLSRQEGLSNKQVAERLSISEKTVETQMTRALARLRKELEWLLCFLSWQDWGGVPGAN
ncbi:MAG: RNA polymerase sigma-70 factor [Odoribacteraceae bacterium]|jgi:RNA polymerase sigma-70 factor (ECF subfamily)|nr:RNA polymerase sigma-70 factor [Odoribacteraceae bacterium]